MVWGGGEQDISPHENLALRQLAPDSEDISPGGGGGEGGNKTTRPTKISPSDNSPQIQKTSRPTS